MFAERRADAAAERAGDEPIDAFEACILDAKSEDDVTRCMQLNDERFEAQEHLEASFMSRSPPMRDANLIRAKAAAAAVVPSEREGDQPTELEACIVAELKSALGMPELIYPSYRHGGAKLFGTHFTYLVVAKVQFK